MIITSGFTKDILRAKGAKVILTNEGQQRLEKVEPLMSRPEYVVKDLYERKGFAPDLQKVAIGPSSGLCKGLAFCVSFDEIKAVVIE